MSNTYDVRLDYPCYGSSSAIEPLHCGTLNAEQVEQYLQELAAQKNIPSDSCAHHFTAHFENKKTSDVFLTRDCVCPTTPREDIKGRLNLYMTNMGNCKCSYRDCFNNIRNGKCTDHFVIENIGKKFFADKYKDKQK